MKLILIGIAALWALLISWALSDELDDLVDDVARLRRRLDDGVTAGPIRGGAVRGTQTSGASEAR